MRAIVRRTKQLGDRGRSTTFRVRGRLVNYKDVVRYWKHKGLQVEDVLAQRLESKTPEAVDCFVSSPSPTMMPAPLETLERILISIQDYYKGSFEVGTWLTMDPRMSCKTTKGQEDAMAHLSALTQQCIIACRLFFSNQTRAAGRTLISAASEIKDILSAEHPMTLTYLFAIVVYMFQQRRHEIALAVLRQFSALAETLMGERHPLRCVCVWLASMHPSQTEEVIVKCSASICDQMESLVGPMSWSTLISRLIFILEVDAGRDLARKTSLLQDILDRCEAALEYLDPRISEVRLYSACHHLKIRGYVKALELGWEIVAHGQQLSIWTAAPPFYIEGLVIVAQSQYALGETFSAVMNLREAINLRMSRWESYDHQVRDWLILLEGWLARDGQLSSAIQVHRIWKRALEDSGDGG